MTTWSLLCFFQVFLFVNSVTCEDDVLLVKMEPSSYFCLTNSTYALAWIDSDMNTVQIDQIGDTEFDCDITNGYAECNPYWSVYHWTIRNSLDSNDGQIILDRRWENFPIIRITNYNAKVSDIKYENFELPISIRSDNNGLHIFLCDQTSPSGSRCYWIVLYGWKQTKSVIRKCTNELVPWNLMPVRDCRASKAERNETNQIPYLTQDEWKHFKIIRKDNIISFTKMGVAEPILSFEDNDELINIVAVIMRKPEDTAEIKIHNYDYTETNYELKAAIIGPTFRSNTAMPKSCISFFYRQCADCVLKFEYGFGNYKNLDNENENWKEITLCYNKSYQTEMSMRIWTSLNKGSTVDRGFWHIDGVRFFYEDHRRGIRRVSTNQNLKCQILSKDSKVIALENIEPQSPVNCPYDTIGPNCFPCQLFLDNQNSCGNLKVCTQIGIDNTCMCSAGYFSDFCNLECFENYYGHGCLQKCGKCATPNCNKITGNCAQSRCLEDYSGDKCDISPGKKLEHAPEVLAKDYTSCTVQVKSPKDFEPFYLFQLQIKEAETNKVWTNYGPLYPIRHEDPIVVGNLHISTKYFIRGVVFVKQNQPSYEGNYINYSVCETTCKGYQDDDIRIVNTTDESVSFKILVDGSSCVFQSVKIEGRIIDNDKGLYVANGLEADRTYNINLIASQNVCLLRKAFKTKEGIPSKVIGLKLSPSSSTSIYLKWEEPLYPQGTINDYVIEYSHLKHKACALNSVENWKSGGTATEKSITIDGLIPFSVYNVSIFARNSLNDGDIAYGTVSTYSSSEFSDAEIPKIEAIRNGSCNQDRTNSYQCSIEIYFAEVNCEMILGARYLKLGWTCDSVWCASNYSEVIAFDKSLTIKSLLPFSDYSVKINICRKKGSDCETRRSTTAIFKTTTSPPNAVKNFVVYSKSGTYISLRWQAPYPPTGILSEYYIKYSTYYYLKTHERYQIIATNQSCHLWPDFICATLTENIFHNYYYTIEISASNLIPSKKWGTTLSFKNCQAAKGVPETPYNLQQTWNEKNDLILSWIPPNITNGDLEYYQIIVNLFNPQQTLNHKNNDIANNNFTLKYIRDVPPSRSFEISIQANNGQYYSYATYFPKDYSPPPFPTLTEDPLVTPSNTSILIDLNLKHLENVHQMVNKSELFLLNAVKSRQGRDYYQNGSLLSCSKVDLDEFEVLKSYDLLNMTKYGYEMRSIDYSPIDDHKNYNLKAVLVNSYQDKKSCSIIYNITMRASLAPEDGFTSSLFPLLLLLLLIPAIIFIVWKREPLVEKLSYQREQFRNMKPMRNFLKRFNRNQDTEVALPLNPSSIPSQSYPVIGDNKNIIPLKKIRRKEPVESPPSTINPKAKIHSKVIKLSEFEHYIKESLITGELEKQHSLFPRGRTKSWSYGELKVNKSKNRYNNLIAYDHTRVILEKINGDEFSDYINANYINGYKMPKAYIATQGPKEKTLYDFWRMVWQENVRNIVMLANVLEGGKKKVEKYWPEINSTLNFNDIRVQYVTDSVCADYEFRVFNLIRNGETRKIEQLHYTTWPDHGVPLYSPSLVPFLQKMLTIPMNQKSPILVHCSAGVGRTGTILLCDICLRMAAREGFIDVLKNLDNLRSQRPNMVDNVEQYKLAHLVIFECLFGMNTSIPCNDVEYTLAKLKNNDGIRSQMRYLKDTAWQDQAMKSVAQVEEEVPIYPEKNRCPDIVPEIQGRIFLCRYPPEDAKSSYINAITVDGFRAPGRFIVTQQPLPETVGDFWRLVEENNISIIVNLNEIDVSDETSCQFWPKNQEEPINPVDYITISLSNTTAREFYDLIDLNLETRNNNQRVPVRMISFKQWQVGSILPESHQSFLTLWEECDIASRRAEKVLITCYDGTTACGMYAAMCFILEKIKLEQVCDVCQAVRSIRHNRPQFITQEEQFEFLYEVAYKYINGFQSYANFN